MIWIILYILIAPFAGKWVYKQHGNTNFSDWATYSIAWIIAVPLTVGFKFDDWVAEYNPKGEIGSKIMKWVNK